MRSNNSRRYWASNKQDVSDIPGATVSTIHKYKWHLKGSGNNLNVRDIVPKQSILENNIHKRSMSTINSLPASTEMSTMKLSPSRRHVFHEYADIVEQSRSVLSINQRQRQRLGTPVDYSQLKNVTIMGMNTLDIMRTQRRMPPIEENSFITTGMTSPRRAFILDESEEPESRRSQYETPSRRMTEHRKSPEIETQRLQESPMPTVVEI